MRTHVFYNKPESACYGCQACAQICPVSAITMEPDREGFLFPKIDNRKCIECNLCEKSCPTQSSVTKPLFYPVTTTVDAAWMKDLDNRIESTSGGIFFALGEKWITSGGVVYGADFDDLLRVRHVRMTTIDGLMRLRGSKYVQSDISHILNDVKTDLKTGRKVLFSGTPCQVAGLRAFLKKDYSNLCTIDLVCHGTPSPKIFAEHLSYIERTYGKKIIKYKFRSKKYSGWRSYISYIFNDGTSISKILGTDFYAYCFYRSSFNRLCCFTCEFSKPERVGDITLSDFWNAEKASPQLRLQRKYGFNMVMCNSIKGVNLYRQVADKIMQLSLPSQVAIDGDVRLRHAEPLPPDRDSIFQEYYTHGYDWLVTNRNIKQSAFSRFLPLWIKNLIYEIKARL